MATKMKDDWDILKNFLPVGWEKKATELGALRRKRKMKNAETLLRTLLIHLAEGKSLRTTSAYAREVGLCTLTDVALLQRLQASQEWFHWMAVELFALLQGPLLANDLFQHYRIRLVDGSSISEPGSTGTDWRLHYSFLLSNLRCDTFLMTSAKTGEAFQRYPVSPGDLLIGDRGYCQRKGILYVLRHQGHVLVRFHSTNLPLFRRSGSPFVVLEHLRQLETEEIGDWNVWFESPDGGKLIKGRLCSMRKSQEAAEKAKKQLRQVASRQGRTLRPETLEHAEYMTVFTTATRHVFKGMRLLSLYRARWQVELVFKRLKSIIGVGHLPKHDPESCLAWLYGKMVVALLVERLYQEAEIFSPGGIQCQFPQHALEKASSTQPVRSPWREFEFWFMVVQQAIMPRLSMNQAIEHWGQIKKKSR